MSATGINFTKTKLLKHLCFRMYFQSNSKDLNRGYHPNQIRLLSYVIVGLILSIVNPSFDYTSRCYASELSQSCKFSKQITFKSPHFLVFNPPIQYVACSNELYFGLGKYPTIFLNYTIGKFVPITFPEDSFATSSWAVSPDGKLLCVGFVDGELGIWDIKTGNLRKKIQTEDEHVTAITFSPDGDMIITGSQSPTVKIWDTDTLELVHTLKSHARGINSVACSPNGNSIASGSIDGTLVLWDGIKGLHTRTVVLNAGPVNRVIFSPTEDVVLAGLSNGDAVVVNLQNDSQRMLKFHKQGVFAVAFSADGKQIGTGSVDKMVVIWDAKTGEIAKVLSGHLETVNSIVFTTDGKFVYSGSNDDTVKRWTIGEWDEVVDVYVRVKSNK